MTLGFYSYIGQFFFAYYNSKTSKLKNKKNLKKKNQKNSHIICGPAVALRGDILTNSCEFIFCHNLVMLVPFCSYGDGLIVKTKKK